MVFGQLGVENVGVDVGAERRRKGLRVLKVCNRGRRSIGMTGFEFLQYGQKK